MKTRAVFLLVSLVLFVPACSADDGAESRPVGSISASLLDGLPHVKLRWAQARVTDLPSGGGYTHAELRATGVVEVENVSYAKQVVVRYKGDAGWADAQATYLGPGPGNDELWSFTTGATTYMPYFGTADLPFAIEYSVAGMTAWDNNGGRNYDVWGAGADLPEPSVALGQDALKVSDFSLTSQSGAVTFAGRVVLKNLAYQKDVTVVYSTDDWRTVLMAKADYAYGFSQGLEQWSFSQTLPASATHVQFAVSYAVDGTTYWDNNRGANYAAAP